MGRQGLVRGLRFASVAGPVELGLGCLAFPHLTRRLGYPDWYVPLYHAPALGGFLWWVAERVRAWPGEARHGPRGRRLWRAGLDIIVVGMGLLRATAPLVPTSGHMLVFTYAALTTPGRASRAIMVPLLLETTWVKLFVWGDWRSWALGGLAGLAMATLYRWLPSADA